MKKLGPIISVVSGAVLFMLSLFGLIVAYNMMDGNDFIGKYTNSVQKHIDASVSVKTMYILLTVIGLAQIGLGVGAFKNPTGISAIILLVLFVIAFGFGIYVAVNADSVAIAAVIAVVMQGLAATGLLFGILKK